MLKFLLGGAGEAHVASSLQGKGWQRVFKPFRSTGRQSVCACE